MEQLTWLRVSHEGNHKHIVGIIIMINEEPMSWADFQSYWVGFCATVNWKALVALRGFCRGSMLWLSLTLKPASTRVILDKNYYDTVLIKIWHPCNKYSTPFTENNSGKLWQGFNLAIWLIWYRSPKLIKLANWTWACAYGCKHSDRQIKSSPIPTESHFTKAKVTHYK